MIALLRGKTSMASNREERRLTETLPALCHNKDGVASDQIDLEAGSIQAIDKQSVHRICSGQVVLTLATAVKELLENSIDAGATTVDIKLKEYGSESIEVTDNGSGVEEKNFVGLTQKHHTSKLSDFSDLMSVATFGFRGEALSSLCALSHMIVTTRHQSVDVGTRLEYDANGHITSKTPVPRQQGTTVSLQNLFHTLPVRHKEFQRNLKKEFSKMVQVLNGYCLVNTGIRITCSNQTNKGNKLSVVSTNGNAAVRDNIANIFGPKQLQSLLPFEQRSPSEDICTDFGIQSNASQSDLFSIEGFVSKCEHGQGRSSSDRQFVFINKRPCDATKIFKVINEVYHSYNRHQNPFVVLLITMAKESVDVNVTPDKRQIFVEGEKILLATIKTSLMRMFEPTTSVLRMNMVPHLAGFRGAGEDSSISKESIPGSESVTQSSPHKFSASTQNGDKDGLSSLARLKRSFSSAFDKSGSNSSPVVSATQPDKQRKLEMFLTKRHSSPARFSPDKGSITSFFKKASSSTSSGKSQTLESTPSDKPESDDVIIVDKASESMLSSSMDETDSLVSDSIEAVQSQDDTDTVETDSRVFHCSEALPSKDSCDTVTNSCLNDTHQGQTQARLIFHEVAWTAKQHTDSDRTSPTQRICDEDRTERQDNDVECCPTLHSQSLMTRCDSLEARSTQSATYMETGKEEGRRLTADEHIPRSEDSLDCHQAVGEEEPVSTENVESTQPSFRITKFDTEERHTRQESELRFSFQQLRQCLAAPEMTSEKKKEDEFSRSFRAKISPTDNKSAEEELQREISKDMFGRMEVLGQFNLGFIIAKHGEDLFIVDQHATDEKYNFEMLQRHTVLQSQQLIQPQNLELTASNEVILMDNMDIFKKNGFDFVIDETALPTQRVKLKSTPVSKNWSFGKDDIEELIFMLTESPGIMCRPSRVRMMFASRSCRKSVMIGTHLNTKEMKKLLCHMGEIEQPWNCPHGRPTMRHLINLNMLPR